MNKECLKRQFKSSTKVLNEIIKMKNAISKGNQIICYLKANILIYFYYYSETIMMYDHDIKINLNNA